jgi:GTP-binding protein Era
VSASKGENLESLARATAALLPEGEAGEARPVEDRGERFQAAEALREQLMIALSDELPYGIAVEIERFEPTADGRTEIDAVIWVERVGQRKIVIGAKGARLKAIGSATRLALNELFGRRVHLNTWVKVREGWSDDDRMLRQLGHEPS